MGLLQRRSKSSPVGGGGRVGSTVLGVDAPVPVAFCCIVLERLASLLTLAYIGSAWLAPGVCGCRFAIPGFS